MSRRTCRGTATTFLLLATACTGQLQFEPTFGDAAGTDRARNSGGAGGATGGQTAGGPGDAGFSSGGASAADVRPNGDAGSATGGDGPTAERQTSADVGAMAADGSPPVASGCPQGFDVLELVFKKRCGACHSAAAPSKNLDLVSAGVGARLVGKLSSCMNRPLIAATRAAGAPPTGLLFDKMAGAVDGCGVQMPPDSALLTATESACVTDWAIGAISGASGM